MDPVFCLEIIEPYPFIIDSITSGSVEENLIKGGLLYGGDEIALPSVLAKFIVYFCSRSSHVDRILAVLEEVAAETEEEIQIEKVKLEEFPELVFTEGVVAAPATDISNDEIHRFVGIPQKQDLLAILSTIKELSRRSERAD